MGWAPGPRLRAARAVADARRSPTPGCARRPRAGCLPAAPLRPVGGETAAWGKGPPGPAARRPVMRPGIGAVFPPESRGSGALAPGRLPRPSSFRAHVGGGGVLDASGLCLGVGGQFTRKTLNKTNGEGCLRWSPVAVGTRARPSGLFPVPLLREAPAHPGAFALAVPLTSPLRETPRLWAGSTGPCSPPRRARPFPRACGSRSRPPTPKSRLAHPKARDAPAAARPLRGPMGGERVTVPGLLEFYAPGGGHGPGANPGKRRLVCPGA